MVSRSVSSVVRLCIAAASVALYGAIALQPTSLAVAGAASGSSELEAWGYNEDGQLGVGTSTGPERCAPLSVGCSTVPVPVSLPSGVTPTAIAGGGGNGVVGYGAGYAIGSDGNLYAWGANSSGQLGDGSLSSSNLPVRVSLPSGVNPTAIAAGFDSGYAIGSDGNLYAWGDNSSGQLGDGNTANSDVPVRVSLPLGVTPAAVAAGAFAAYATGSNGSLYSWGNNGFGQLGDGNTANSEVPVEVRLSPGVTTKAIAGGGGMGYAVGSDDKMYAWGENGYGQLGDGTSTGPANCSSGVPCSTTPVTVSLPTGVSPKTISGGGYAGYAIGSDGHLYAWGLNDVGELGVGTSTGPESCPYVPNSPCSTTPVSVLLPSGVTPQGIAGGDFTGYAIGSDQNVYAWGLNQGGQLGDGTSTGPDTCSNLPCGSTPVRVSLPIGSSPQKLGLQPSSGSGYALVSADNDLSLSQPPNITNVNATGPSGAVVTYATPTVSDPDDKTLPTLSCSPASGSTFAIGTTTVICSVSDPDDTNSPVSVSFSVSVLGAQAQLVNLRQSVTGVGPDKVLSRTVGAAQSLLSANHVQATCFVLKVFVFEVEVLAFFRSISPATASQLVASANRIENVLGC